MTKFQRKLSMIICLLKRYTFYMDLHLSSFLEMRSSHLTLFNTFIYICMKNAYMCLPYNTFDEKQGSGYAYTNNACD